MKFINNNKNLNNLKKFNYSLIFFFISWDAKAQVKNIIKKF